MMQHHARTRSAFQFIVIQGWQRASWQPFEWKYNEQPYARWCLFSAVWLAMQPELRQIKNMNNPWKLVALALSAILFGLFLSGMLLINLVVDFANRIIGWLLALIELIRLWL